MGTWSTGLFSNDTTCDIRDTYIDFLKQQLSDKEAYEKTYESYKELIGTDEEPLFWYALAETQWNAGRLTSEVKIIALEFIKNNLSFDNWSENTYGSKKWEKTLKRLQEKITSPMPPPKRYRKPIEFIRNPWDIGDVYAYQFHSDKAKSNNLHGKYILMQKIADIEYYDGHTYSAIQIFNKIYDSIPNLKCVENIPILPLIYSPKTCSNFKVKSDYIPSFEWFTKATMIYSKKNDYPHRYLTFVVNINLLTKQYAVNSFSDMDWDKNEMENWIIDYYLSWENVNEGDRGWFEITEKVRF